MNIPIHIQKFKQEMKRRFMSTNTIGNYGSCATSFLTHFKDKEHPSHITDTDFADYLFSEFSDQNTQRANHSAIKKFYEVCFNKKRFKFLPYAQKKHTNPIILSEEEVQRLLQATTNIKHFAITLTLYATGVRISELLNIKLSDIDRANGVIHIMNGKGAKQRQVCLKPKLLEVITAYYRKYKPFTYLFENDLTHQQYSERSVGEFLKANAEKAGIKKRVYPHLLRHCNASHCIEHGESLYTVQTIMGHSDPKITANTYVHGSSKIIANSYSPLDNLTFKNRLTA